MANKEIIANIDSTSIVMVLNERFEKNMVRHPKLKWGDIEKRFTNNNINSLMEMEKTGGEPDVIEYKEDIDKYLFCDLSAESPIGRRSLCYDEEALESRKAA